MTSALLALVLSVREISESDLWVNLLSPEKGRLAVVAKGARRSRRRFVNKLEGGHLLRVHLRPRRPSLVPFLEAADLVFAPEGLRRDPFRFALAGYFLELAERSSPPAEGREIFPLLLEGLRLLDQRKDPFLLKTAFELHLLRLLGWSPELERCVTCGCPLGLVMFFSFTGGGVRCSACAEEGDRRMPPKFKALLFHLGGRSLRTLFRLRVREEAVRELEKLTEVFLKRVLDQDIKALKVLRELATYEKRT